MNPQDSYIFTKFEPGSFWARRRNVVLKNTLPFQLDMLRKTGRYDAFDLQWHASYSDPPTAWPVPNHLFWDSDVAKWIEGVSYFSDESSEVEPDNANAVHDLVRKIQKAQQEDGYLNIHFTVVAPGERWSNLRDLHELYNAGHLVEGALAHSRCYKSEELLRPIEKYVELIFNTFGPGKNQKHGYPGHPEIELALIRLYKRTGNKKYLDLARYFIEERGNLKGVEGRHYYDVEATTRGESSHTLPLYYPAPRSYWYQQAHKPILEQETIEGHSVRAMYLLTAVADLAVVDHEDFRSRYEPALRRLWENMVHRKMYLTGGIGAMKQWEGFGIDYFLPQGSDEGGCYSETCAAIGIMMLAERLLQLDLNGEYGDILERCLYNAMLTGMSIDGKGFTYVNQLASSPGNPSKREEWFECACCPPNVARVLGNLGGYLCTATTTGEDSVNINVHLYASATLDYQVGEKKEGDEPAKTVKLTQSTNYPWEGTVDFSLTADESTSVTIRLRVPAWADSYEVTPAPPSPLTLEKSYLTLPSTYLKSNSTFRLTLPIQPRLIHPHPYTNQPIAALARGPIIYCLEDHDHPWVTDDFKSLCLIDTASTPSSPFLHTLQQEWKTDLPLDEGYISITAPKSGHFLRTTLQESNSNPTATQHARSDSLDQPNWSSLLLNRSRDPVDLHFIPYFARANRGGKGMMRVGIRILGSGMSS